MLSEQTKLVLAIVSGAIVGAYGARRLAGASTAVLVVGALAGGFAGDWAIRQLVFSTYEDSGEAQRASLELGDFSASQRSALANAVARPNAGTFLAGGAGGRALLGGAA